MATKKVPKCPARSEEKEVLDTFVSAAQLSRTAFRAWVRARYAPWPILGTTQKIQGSKKHRGYPEYGYATLNEKILCHIAGICTIFLAIFDRINT
jgi:hypothetical protein